MRHKPPMFIWKFPALERLLFSSCLLVIIILVITVFFARHQYLNQYRRIKKILPAVANNNPVQNQYGPSAAQPYVETDYKQMLASLTLSDPYMQAAAERFIEAQQRGMGFNEEALSEHSGTLGGGFRNAIAELAQPLQQETEPAGQKNTTDPRTAPFKVSIGGDVAKIMPMAAYSLPVFIIGVTHNTAYSSISKIPAVNLGGLWGANARQQIYRRLSVDASMYGTRIKPREIINPAQYSNTLILAQDSKTRRKLKSLKNGDQVLINGELAAAEFTDMKGRVKKSVVSSLRRDDLGAGATEVMFVKSSEDIIILKKAPYTAYAAYITAIGLLFLYIILIFVRIYLELKHKKRTIEQESRPKFIALGQ